MNDDEREQAEQLGDGEEVLDQLLDRWRRARDDAQRQAPTRSERELVEAGDKLARIVLLLKGILEKSGPSKR